MDRCYLYIYFIIFFVRKYKNNLISHNNIYIFCSTQIMKFENGFYIIKKGTKIYRGDNRMYLGENTWQRISNRPTFFALTHREAEEEYGVTYEFVTKKECKLLALDHKETVSELLSVIDEPEIKRIIQSNYGYKSTRNSFLQDDLKVTNYLCSKGYEGYATKEMETDAGGHFHPEIMICEPDKFVGLPKQVTVDEQKIQNIIKDYEEKRMARRLKEERDMKRRSKKKSFFEDDNEEDEDNFNRFQSNSSNLFTTVLFPKSSDFTPPRIKSLLPPAFTLSSTPPRRTGITSSLFHSPSSHKKSRKRKTPSPPKKGGTKKNNNKQKNKNKK